MQVTDEWIIQRFIRLARPREGGAVRAVARLCHWHDSGRAVMTPSFGYTRTSGFFNWFRALMRSSSDA